MRDVGKGNSVLLHRITPSFREPDQPVPYDTSSTSNSALPMKGLSPYTTLFGYISVGAFFYGTQAIV